MQIHSESFCGGVFTHWRVDPSRWHSREHRGAGQRRGLGGRPAWWCRRRWQGKTAWSGQCRYCKRQINTSVTDNIWLMQNSRFAVPPSSFKKNYQLTDHWYSGYTWWPPDCALNLDSWGDIELCGWLLLLPAEHGVVVLMSDDFSRPLSYRALLTYLQVLFTQLHSVVVAVTVGRQCFRGGLKSYIAAWQPLLQNYPVLLLILKTNRSYSHRKSKTNNFLFGKVLEQTFGLAK